MNDRPEDEASKRYRLHSEQECRRIAAIIRDQLAKGLAFILITADYGEAGAGFSNTSYVASMHRDDGARLLTELLDYWRNEGGTVTEPSVQTATRIREQVYRDREEPIERLLHSARCSVRDAVDALRMRDREKVAMAAMKMVCEGMAIFDRIVREVCAPPPAGTPS